MTNSVQLRIEQIANGYLFQTDGAPIYCKDKQALERNIEWWLAESVESMKKAHKSQPYV